MSQKGNNLSERRSIPPISEQTVQQLIETQSREQALRSQELQIRNKEIEFQSKHASEMLSAQERDREKAREHQRRMQRGPLICIGVLVVVVLIFIGCALYMDKDATVQEIIKLVFTFIAGGGAGYGIRASKKEQQDE